MLFLQTLSDQILQVGAPIKRIVLLNFVYVGLLSVVPVPLVVDAEFRCACSVVVVCVSEVPLWRFLEPLAVDGRYEGSLGGEGVGGRRGIPEQHIEI